MNDVNNTFRAGICMAGAVSAGAYTAGVVDYLLEALEHWQHAKDLQEAGKLTGVPRHNFLIEVLSGASAGGMTAAITAAAVQNDFPHLTPGADCEVTGKQNPLYDAWVNLTEVEGKDMMDFMLENDDILCENNPDKEVRSGFNSNFITTVADKILAKAAKTSDCKRPYIASDADIFTTVTNLRGFHYKITFNTTQGKREHRMMMHKDLVCMRLSESEDYMKDGRIPVNFKKPDSENRKILIDAAMATGAFPLGLESRELTRKKDYIAQNKYLNLRIEGVDDKSVDYEFTSEDIYNSLNVDGGVINNEPFDTTEKFLEDRRRSGIEKKRLNEELKAGTDKTVAEATAKVSAAAFEPSSASASTFDTIVLMVDPFPNDDQPLTTTFTALKAWRFVLPKVLSAMRGQLMLKEDEIRRAYLSDDYSRFLISPVRTSQNEPQKYSIACGSLGGFGGFFHKEFRKHDFYLGRRNCQRFLQRHFSAPAEAGNPILAYGYEGIAAKFQYEENGKLYLPVIPDFRVEMNKETGVHNLVTPPEEKEMAYPQISLRYLLSLQKKIEKSITCILDNVKNGTDPDKVNIPENPVLKRIRKPTWLGSIANKLIKKPLTNLYFTVGKSMGKAPAAEMFIDTVIEDMDKRGLLNVDC